MSLPISVELSQIPVALSWSLMWSAAARSLMQRCRPLRNSLNIVKHYETLVKHCDTSWNVVKHREPLVKHHETLKTLWNIMKHWKHCETLSNTLKTFWYIMKHLSAEYAKRVTNISLFIYIGSPGLHPNSRQAPGSSRQSLSHTYIYRPIHHWCWTLYKKNALYMDKIPFFEVLYLNFKGQRAVKKPNKCSLTYPKIAHVAGHWNIYGCRKVSIFPICP